MEDNSLEARVEEDDSLRVQGTLKDRVHTAFKRVVGEERMRKLQKYRLYDTLERRLGAERLERIKTPSFGSTARAIMGKKLYIAVKGFLDRQLKERTYSIERVDKLAEKMHAGLSNLSRETYYEFFVDALAQNIFSLVYVLNDKYVGHKSWKAAWATRGTAAVGNTITGRPYGAWQDYVITVAQEFFYKLEETDRWQNEIGPYLENHRLAKKSYEFTKWYAPRVAAFATGQSWLYYLFLRGGDMLAGEETDHDAVWDAVKSLTALAPLLGPLSDKTYQLVRTQFGLPAVPERREEIESLQTQRNAAS